VPDSAFSTNSFVRVFGKPESHKGRRLAVALVIDSDVEKAKTKAKEIANSLTDK